MCEICLLIEKKICVFIFNVLFLSFWLINVSFLLGNNVGPGLGPQQQGQMPDLAQLLKGQGRPPPQQPQSQQMPIGGPLQNILQQPPPVANRGVSPGKQPDPSQFPAALHHLLKLGATMPPMNKQPNQVKSIYCT